MGCCGCCVVVVGGDVDGALFCWSCWVPCAVVTAACAQETKERSVDISGRRQNQDAAVELIMEKVLYARDWTQKRSGGMRLAIVYFLGGASIKYTYAHAEMGARGKGPLRHSS